jgi:hypothetical protein
MARTTPEREHAEGMLAAIHKQRESEGQTGPHPYATLDLDDPVDRRIVGSVYSLMVREALDSVKR